MPDMKVEKKYVELQVLYGHIKRDKTWMKYHARYTRVKFCVVISSQISLYKRVYQIKI